MCVYIQRPSELMAHAHQWPVVPAQHPKAGTAEAYEAWTLEARGSACMHMHPIRLSYSAKSVAIQQCFSF
jgi:hypothetical protein